MSIRLKLTLLVSALFFTVIVNALFTFRLENHSDKNLYWVVHTHHVISEVEILLSSLKDAETGQRGFLLTSDASYLEPFHTGFTKSKKSFNALKEMTIDNLDQQNRLIEVEKFMTLKFKELKKTIHLREIGEYQDALRIVKRGIGKKYMDDIRNILEEFIHHEKILLEKRNGDLKAVRSRLTTLMFVEFAVFLILAVITVLFLKNNLFDPLNRLLHSTQKMDKGEEVLIEDITSRDEMGYLLSSFFKMNQKVHERTEILSYKAHHDELTGLLNRTTLFQDVQDSINSSMSKNIKTALLFIDLNKFKDLNDTMGHDAGDYILIETAKRLNESIRNDDKIYRIGGDEFLILINSFLNSKDLERIVSKIMKSIEKPVPFQGGHIPISLSIGVAIAPDDSKNSDQLLKMADLAMYASKVEKNSHFSFFNKSMLKRSSDTV
ncbi:MAG: diguanylate cyclase [Leptospirales bacterium]